jgi:Surface-adhesin protein E
MPAVLQFALIIWCFAIPADALAAAWKHIAVSDDGLVNFYMDAEGVAAKGSTRRVRLLFDFSVVQQDPDTLIEHRSTIEMALLDCRRRTIAPIEAVSYAENKGRGRPVVSTKSPQPLRHVAAAPQSIDERVVEFVCQVR